MNNIRYHRQFLQRSFEPKKNEGTEISVLLYVCSFGQLFILLYKYSERTYDCKAKHKRQVELYSDEKNCAQRLFTRSYIYPNERVFRIISISQLHLSVPYSGAT